MGAYLAVALAVDVLAFIHHRRAVNPVRDPLYCPVVGARWVCSACTDARSHVTERDGEGRRGSKEGGCAGQPRKSRKPARRVINQRLESNSRKQFRPVATVHGQKGACLAVGLAVEERAFIELHLALKPVLDPLHRALVSAGRAGGMVWYGRCGWVGLQQGGRRHRPTRESE